MKSIFVIAFVATFAAVNVLAGLTPEEAMAHASACRKQLNISDAEFSQLASAETFAEVNEKSKCFFNCFQEEEGTLIDGVIQEEKVIGLFEGSVGAKKAQEIYEICKKSKGAEKCEIAFNLQICYKENGLF